MTKWISRTLSALSLFVLFGLATPSAVAQAGRDKDRDRKDAPTERQLEMRADEAEAALLTEYMEIASEFYKQGQKEKSLEILGRIEKLDPGAPGLRQKIQTIREEMMVANGLDVEIETNRGWGNPIAEVEEGKPFRVTAAGEYKLTLTATIPLSGLPVADPSKDYAPGIPFGALMGVIVTDGKPSDPFLISAQAEVIPKKSGVLLIRPNVPVAAKCTGTLKAHLSGNLKPAPPAARRN